MPADTRSFLIVLPAKNESLVLARNVALLVRFLDGLPGLGAWRIVIADNGSTDATPRIAAELAAADARIAWFHLDDAGRGRALAKAWNDAVEDILCYMDVDLSVGLEALPHLVGEIRRGADIAYGSRFAPGAEVTRSLVREITSRGYLLLARLIVGLKAQDAQCGFKAISKQAWVQLKTRVIHPGWFFDTELLLRAEAAGMRLSPVPVLWVEARDARRKSTVKLWQTIRGYVRDLMAYRRRVRQERRTPQG